MVFAHSGNCAKQSATWITPMPRATDKPTTAVFLVLSPSFTTSLMPVMAIMANTDTVAPPSTQEGTVVSRAENLGISPASTIRLSLQPVPEPRGLRPLS